MYIHLGVYREHGNVLIIEVYIFQGVLYKSQMFFHVSISRIYCNDSRVVEKFSVDVLLLIS